MSPEKKKEKKSTSQKMQEDIRKRDAERDKRSKELAKKAADLPRPSGTFVALHNIGTPRVCYQAGQRYKVGIDLTEEQARSYLASGFIEQFNPLPGPSETK